MKQESIKKILETQAGKDLQKFLRQSIQSLDRVSDIDVSSPQDIALETLARKKAVGILAEILKEFITFEEVTKEEKPEVY